jgi:anaerobic magnesium-protoporphyrin IX monomethyl ester cyclase
MRILLANLPREAEIKDYTTREYLLTDYTRYPPLGLLAIAANVNPKHSIKVLDVLVSNMSIEDVVQYITDYKPDILGLSVVTRRLYSLWEVSRRVRESLPDTAIVAGGPHVNYWPEETMHLGTLDYVLPGYGERSSPLLVDAV